MSKDCYHGFQESFTCSCRTCLVCNERVNCCNMHPQTTIEKEGIS